MQAGTIRLSPDTRRWLDERGYKVLRTLPFSAEEQVEVRRALADGVLKMGELFTPTFDPKQIVVT